MRKLDVIVVGAGIGGLQTALALAGDGHSVTVLESVKEFLEVGAGIRVPPNSSRLSRTWGVDFSQMKKESSLGNRFVDWKGKNLLDIPLHNVEETYGAPYYFIHRADLINTLVDAAKKQNNISLKMGCKVAGYDFEAPAVSTSTGERISADLIICADGIKSSVRDIINGRPMPPMDTGDVAYRILVPAAPLLADPAMRDFVTEPWATHWMGPEGHAVGYPLREGELYNIIIDITHATDLGQAVGDDEWKAQADNAELVARFADWCEPVRKLCALTGTYLKWKLADFDQLDRWVHPSGKVALLGDSSHPMTSEMHVDRYRVNTVPYAAQGAAMATEDAATLRAALAKFDSIPEALNAYERQRKPRAAYIARNTRVLQEWLHLYDGPEQERRDELMKTDGKDNPMLWGWKERRDWLFGHDAQVLVAGGDSEGWIPDLPPMPVKDASVYSEEFRRKN